MENTLENEIRGAQAALLWLERREAVGIGRGNARHRDSGAVCASSCRCAADRQRYGSEADMRAQERMMAATLVQHDRSSCATFEQVTGGVLRQSHCMPSARTVEQFVARVEAKARVEAVEEFYTENSSVRENQGEPRIGREAAVNPALEGFVVAAAIELTRGLRVNLVSPPFLEESMPPFGSLAPSVMAVPAATAAQAFKRSILGAQTGQIYKVRASGAAR